MAEEKIYFQNSNGVRLCGILSGPSDDKSLPVVILCHGFTSSKDSDTFVRLERELNDKNIATLRFDFFGHGESEGDFAEITISEGVDDILRAIDYLKVLGYSRIGLFGSSFGGICALMAASKTDALYLLAAKSPVSDWQELHRLSDSEAEMLDWKEKGFRTHMNGHGVKFRLNYDIFLDAAKNVVYDVAGKIKIPTLIVHGDRDEEVPVEQSQKTTKLLLNGKLEIIKGANHRYSGDGHYERMIKIISEFIIDNT